jgi:hypothetical protein
MASPSPAPRTPALPPPDLTPDAFLCHPGCEGRELDVLAVRLAADDPELADD